MQRGLFILLGVIVLALAGTSYYFYAQNRTLTMNPDEASELAATALAAEVSKFLVLPTDEVPTIATVVDPQALKAQAFFADAKKGDQVLIYGKAQKAVLYDPVAKKVVNVAPVNIGGGSGALDAAAPSTNTAPSGGD